MMLPTIILRIERWKFNKDFGVYVSSQGNFKDRQKRRLPIRVNQNGYCMVKTERGLILAHRLVMFTWKPIPNAESLTVDHLNHNKRDNSVENLEWVTREENQLRAKNDFVRVEDNEEKISKNDFVRVKDNEEKISKKNPSPVPNLTLAAHYRFKNLSKGIEFEDGFAAAKWAYEETKAINASVDTGAKKLVAACKRDGKWCGMRWKMIPKESE